MINVQVDLDEGAGPGEGTAIWSGVLPQIPPTGDTMEIRRWGHGFDGCYRVKESHWILSAQSDHTSVIITVVRD